MRETERPVTGFHVGSLYLGLAVVCIVLGIYLMARGAFDSAVTIFMVGAGSAMLALSREKRLVEAGLSGVLRYGGGATIVLAVVMELIDVL